MLRAISTIKASFIPFIFILFFPFLSFSETLRILHFNDVYEIMPQTEGGHELGGLAPLKTLIKQHTKNAANTIVTFGGDLRPATVDGNPMDSLDMVDILNEVGVQAAVFGNHEFDEGEERTFKFIKNAKFPWLSTNILDQHNKPYGGASKYQIKQVGRFKVALIGLLTPETSALSSPGQGVFFANVVETAKSTVKELKEQGVDVIVAMTHLSIAEDKNLMSKVPEIDLIIGEHDHDPISLFIGGRMIHKSGNNAEYLGVIDLEITKADGKVYVLPRWQMLPVTDIKPDHVLAKKISDLLSKASHEFEKPVAMTEVAIDSRNRTVRSTQSALGSLVADALREAMKADIGILNGGSMRGNSSYPAGSQLLLKHISNELSFQNTVVVREITGKKLRVILEAALEHTPDPSGGFPHISGFEVTYDSSRPKGQKVVYMARNGKEVLMKDSVTLATTNCIANGGDGLPDLSDCKGMDTEHLYSNIVTDYLQAHATITKDILKPRVVEKSIPSQVLIGASSVEHVQSL